MKYSLYIYIYIRNALFTSNNLSKKRGEHEKMASSWFINEIDRKEKLM